VSALSTAGVTVAVTQSAGVLTMTSSRYGSASIVALTGGTAQTDVFGTQVETVGVDIAGTIGGSAATGTGQTLTGSGNALGLAMKVTGGAIGDRGTVNYARGYAYELEKLAGKMLETGSLVAGRIDGINSSVEDITNRRTAMNQRLVVIERRFRAQFSALDGMMARMQQTSDFLTQQLANLPRIN
jgi:flagellar hook-associated protein 2